MMSPLVQLKLTKVCSVCSGSYKDDIEEKTGNVLLGCDWIHCGEIDCGVRGGGGGARGCF